MLRSVIKLKTEFNLVDGRIILTVKQPIWSYDSEEEESIVLGSVDVTDKVMPVAKELDDKKFNELLEDYKRIDGVITYVGEDKDRYEK